MPTDLYLLGLPPTLALILVLLILAPTLIIFPIFSILRCLRMGRESSSGKTLWILAMLFTWPLGGLFYAFIKPDTATYKTFLFLAIALPLFTATLWYATVDNKLSSIVEHKTQHLHAILADRAHYGPHITKGKRANMRLFVNALEREIDKTPLHNQRRLKVRIALIDLLSAMLGDNLFTIHDYNDWTVKFKMRNDLSPATIQNSIAHYERKR